MVFCVCKDFLFENIIFVIKINTGLKEFGLFFFINCHHEMLVPKAGYLFNQEEDWEIWWMIHKK